MKEQHVILDRATGENIGLQLANYPERAAYLFAKKRGLPIASVKAVSYMNWHPSIAPAPAPAPQPGLTDLQQAYLNDAIEQDGIVVGSHHIKIRRTYEALVSKGKVTRHILNPGWVKYIPTA